MAKILVVYTYNEKFNKSGVGNISFKINKISTN